MPTPGTTLSAKITSPKGAGHGTVDGLRQFSIPLRKTTYVPSPPVRMTEKTPEVEKVEKVVPPATDSVKQPEKKAPPATPLFTPRQISATVKLKKNKPKRLGEQQPRRVVVVMEESKKTIPTAKSITPQNLEEDKVPTPPSPLPGRSILDVAEGESPAHVSKHKPTHGFKAVAMSEQPASDAPQSLSHLPPLPPIAGSEPPPSSPVDRATQMLPLGGTSSSLSPQRLGSLRLAPFSLKPKVARVTPLPHSIGRGGSKPIARVKPNMHLSPPSSKEDTSASFLATPQAPPRMSPWTITPRNDSEDGGEHHKHRTRDEGWRHASPHPSSGGRGREDREEHQSRHRHKKKHKKSSSSRRRHAEYEHSLEKRREHGHSWRDESRKRSHHSFHSESPLISTESSSDSDASYGRSGGSGHHQRHSSGKRHHSSSHKRHKHRHRSPSRERWSSEERRRERKRSHSDRYRSSERSTSPEDRKYKKTKAEVSTYPAAANRREGDSNTRKLCPGMYR